MTSEQLWQLEKLNVRVAHEVNRIHNLHGGFASTHEGYGVIQEEVDELWDLIKANKANSKEGLEECVQIAACAIKFAHSLITNDN